MISLSLVCGTTFGLCTRTVWFLPPAARLRRSALIGLLSRIKVAARAQWRGVMEVGTESTFAARIRPSPSSEALRLSAAALAPGSRYTFYWVEAALWVTTWT